MEKQKEHVTKALQNNGYYRALVVSIPGGPHHSHHCLSRTHTHSHSNAPLHPPLVRDYLEDFGSTQDLYCFRQYHILRQEHRRALASGSTAQSAVAGHAVDQMLFINWKEAQVMTCHPYYCQRCALEAWHIWTECQIINRDAAPLPLIVNDPLIHQSICELTVLLQSSSIITQQTLCSYHYLCTMYPHCFYSSITLHYIFPAHLIT